MENIGVLVLSNLIQLRKQHWLNKLYQAVIYMEESLLYNINQVVKNKTNDKKKNE